MRCNSQENAVFIAIHPTSYRSGGFLAHGVLNIGDNDIKQTIYTNISVINLCYLLIYFMTDLCYYISENRRSTL